ncbi:MAG: protein-glutamate methylesterase/protein-glutamine glutaminase [Wenzhouxiangella sp.]
MVRVLIVDDSALVRTILTKVLDSDPEIEVVGSAPDPFVARDKIKLLNPDVITLDIEMPRMDGITFLKNLMRLRPMPVVMVSTLTQHGADETLKALALGAVDYVGKPQADIGETLGEYAQELIEKVKSAASSRPRTLRAAPAPRIERFTPSRRRLVVMGASTGGTQAVREILEVLPATAPPMVIAQHIPASFSQPFAERLDQHSAMTVCEAEDGMRIQPGHAYIAPGDRHLGVGRSGLEWVCQVHDGKRVNRHRPSVDVLFLTAARHVGKHAIGVLLTGMGDDGARGLKALHEAGAETLVQDEATSVVWGMPGAAVRLGASDQVLPLGEIPQALLALAAARDSA